MATYAPDYRFAKRLRKISTLCLLSILFYGCKQYPGSSEKRGEIKRELAGMPLKNFVLQRVAAYREAALQDRFDEAERQLALLRTLLSHFPHEQLECTIKNLEVVLQASREKKRIGEESIQKDLERKAKCEAAARRAREEADRELKQQAEREMERIKEPTCCTIS